MSAITVSFIFLVRTEGFAFLLPFLIAFLIKKQYKCIPFLFTGFILFSLIGWIFYYHDFWWLVNLRPYATGGTSVYGSGDWYYFIVRMPQYFGYVVPLFLLAGSVYMVMHWFKKGLSLQSDHFFLILLVLGSFWGYFFIHSYLWWVGETSAGLYRVMAGIAPLSGFITVFFIHTLAGKKQWRGIIPGAVIILALFLVVSASAFYHRSTSHDLSAEILERVTDWLKRPENIKHKLVVHNPYFAFSTGIDAWDSEVVQYGFSDHDSPEEGLPDSTLFVWDAHFSANEGGMPLEKIMKNKNFEVVHYFEPVVPFKVLGNNDYKIFIFRKISGLGRDNASILKEIQQEELEKGVYYAEVYDFENSFTDSKKEERRILTDIDSLNYIYNLDGTDFSPAFHVPVTQIDDEAFNKLRITADIRLNEPVQTGKLLMVFSIERDSEVFHYATSDISEQNPEQDVWSKAEFIFVVPRQIKKGTLLKTYIWNIEKNNVLLDNFKIEYIRQSS